VSDETAKGRDLSRRAALWLLAALLLAGAGLRFWRIGSKELWLDECISALAAQGSPAQTVANVAEHDAHPPLYYLLLNLTTRLTGRHAAGLRALSALAGVAVIALAYAIGAELFTRRAGLLAAAGLAASSFQLYFAQEARLHALATLLVLAATWVFIRILRDRAGGRKQAARMAAYGLLALAALYTYYYAVFALAAHALGFAVLWLCGRTQKRNWILTPDRARAVWPMLLTALAAAGTLFALGWGDVAVDRLRGASDVPSAAFGARIVLDALRQFLTGPVVDRLALAPSISAIDDLLLLLLVLPAAGIALAARRRPGAAVLLGACVAVPFTCVALLPARPHIFEAKHLVFVAPFLFLMAVAPDDGRRARGGVAAAAAVLILIAVNTWANAVYVRAAYHKEPWRAVAAQIRAGMQPGDVVVVTPPYLEHPLRRHCRVERVIAAPLQGVFEIKVFAARHRGGIWLVQGSSNVAHPNHAVWLSLTKWEGPSREVPGLDQVSLGIWRDRPDQVIGEGSVGAVMASWPSKGKVKSLFFGPLFEGFSTFRTAVAVRRFARARAASP